MATPNWDILHTQFASQVRDGVPAANVSGLELTVADRDSYLNSAYGEYIRLLQMYNPDAINRIIPELAKSGTVTAVSGSALVSTDFGYLINLRNTSNVNAEVDYLDPDEFSKMSKVTDTHQSTPTSTMIYFTIKGRYIEILPSDNSDNYEVTYIVKPLTITQGGSNDIVIPNNHWSSIIELAKSEYFNGKYETDLGDKCFNKAVLLAPFKIGERK